MGDFEGDSVLGSPVTGGLTTLVGRASRFLLLAKIETPLNNRPRKCLGYVTHAEIFHQKTIPARCT